MYLASGQAQGLPRERRRRRSLRSLAFYVIFVHNNKDREENRSEERSEKDKGERRGEEQRMEQILIFESELITTF